MSSSRVVRTNVENCSDDVLMQRVCQGDTQAFQHLVNQYLVKLHGFARRVLGNAGDAEDVVQETFIRAWNNASQWQPNRAKLSTWLYSIAYHLCIDFIRRTTRLPTVVLDDNELSEIPESQDSLLQEEISQQVEMALQQLPERQRSAIVLCYYQEMTNHEAAHILNISVSALESLLARGRKSLREKLQTQLASGETV